MGVTSLILTCFCMSLSVYFCCCQNFTTCDIDQFEVQKDFNASQFEGYWYAISANRLFNPFQVAMSNPNSGGYSGFMGGGSGMLSGFNVGMPRQMPMAGGMQNLLRNLHYYFEMSENSTMLTLASGSIMGRRCFYAQGTSTPANLSIAAKNDYSFRGSLFPIWVVSTDYVGYAVIYSCWDTNAQGECSGDSAHVITLNRVIEGHTTAELAKVDEVSNYLCVPPTSLLPVRHDGGCAFNASYFPLREFSMMNDINLQNPTAGFW